MSLFPTRSLRIELAPDQVNLVESRRRLALGGARTTIRHQRLAAAPAAAAAPPWRGAVQALEAALPAHAGRAARVILSSRLVRYALVPWSDALVDAEEEAAFARHCFARIYGEAAGAWDIRVGDEREGAQRLACAVDAALPEALRAAFAAAHVRLDSIQPNLMAVCNEYRSRLRSRHAWLALLEPGSLCLALLNQGRWTRLRSMRIGPGWRAELVLILEREACLAGAGEAPRDVFLWASGLAAVKLPEGGPWQFHLLAKPQRRGEAPADAARPLAAEG